MQFNKKLYYPVTPFNHLVRPYKCYCSPTLSVKKVLQPNSILTKFCLRIWLHMKILLLDFHLLLVVVLFCNKNQQIQCWVANPFEHVTTVSNFDHGMMPWSKFESAPGATFCIKAMAKFAFDQSFEQRM